MRSIPLAADEQRHLDGPAPKIRLADRPNAGAPPEAGAGAPTSAADDLAQAQLSGPGQPPAPHGPLPDQAAQQAVQPPLPPGHPAQPAAALPNLGGAPVQPPPGAPDTAPAAHVQEADLAAAARAVEEAGVDDGDPWIEVDNLADALGEAQLGAAPSEAAPLDAAPPSEPAPTEGPGLGATPGVVVGEPAGDFAVESSLSPRHQLEAWLATMVKTEASDLILRAGGRPSVRVNGKIQFLPGRVPNSGPLLEVLDGVVGSERMSGWSKSGSVDIALDFDGLGRFRLNAYRQMGEPALVLRRIANKVPPLDSLNLPSAALKKLVKRTRGIVLVTGIAGSGKSTTLAAMIQHVNKEDERHIITLEDPVETVFKEERCVISQREVGTDCATFHEGLRHSLRQSPDVILIGEMRDAETVAAALDATETGHMVMSTLHTVNAPQTLDRILGFFPAEQHKQISIRLGENLAAVLSLRLLPTRNGDGMVPACELMTTTPHVRELLGECKTAEVSRVIEQGTEPGQISFNQSLRRLVERGLVDLDVAISASDRPDELLMALRGITGGDSHRRRVGNEGGRLKMAD